MSVRERTDAALTNAVSETRRLLAAKSLPMEPPGPSLAAYAASRLESLCRGAGMESQAAEITKVFTDLVSPWANRPLRHLSQWRSEISDDETPIEFSVAQDAKESEIRVLFEPQGAQPTLSSYRAAALSFHDRLEREFGADLRRFRLVSDLFAPQDMLGPFAIWNSVVFRANRQPTFKSYFNPQACGAGLGPVLVEEALTRLGFPGAWARLCRTALARGPWLDELKYFALDLTDDAKARIKVYVRHHAASPEELEGACSAAVSYRPGEALAFASAMGGDHDVLRRRATFTCNAFVEGEGDCPVATTLYVPVCAYAPNDEVVLRRVTEYLQANGFGTERYRRLLESFADRPLDAGVGMQSWVAFRRYEEQERLTVYLSTEARRVYEPGSIPAATGDRWSFASVGNAVASLDAYSLSDHPLLRIPAVRRADTIELIAWVLLHGVVGPASEESDELATALLSVADRLRTLSPAHRSSAAQSLVEGLHANTRTLAAKHGLSVSDLRPVVAVLANGIALGLDSTPPAREIDGSRPGADGPYMAVLRSREPQAILLAHQLLWRFLDDVYANETGG